ncbi:MAG: 6-phosphogluconolactonase, partial [Actinomycetota bacterium]
DDGHIASLFPGSSALESPELCAAVDDSPKPPSQRITLTNTTFANISNRWLLAVGASKAKAVAEYSRDGLTPVRQFDPTEIFADEAAYK